MVNEIKNHEWLELIEKVTQSGLPNFKACRVTVNTHWNIQLLHSLLREYDDKEVIDLLQFGFPIERDNEIPLEMGGINHNGATKFEEHIDRYIQAELSHSATIGPFEAIPFNGQVAISPLSSRAKKESEKRRIIMDCSWPVGFSLNDGINKNKYLGKDIVLHYPTIDDICKRVYMLTQQFPGEDILFYKEDMTRAFRQVSVCPRDIPLLGYRWRGMYYWDLVMVMGCRICPYIMQRVTDIITFIHSQMGYTLFNYVDDFIGVEIARLAWPAHTALQRLMRDIGADRVMDKSVTPTEECEILGNLINSKKYTIGVTSKRMFELMNELNSWRFKVLITRQELESLIGKLQFICNCVRPGRLFVSRLIEQLKGMQRGVTYEMSEEARWDIKWWWDYLPRFQGTGILWLLNIYGVDTYMATDASLKGAGAICKNQYYRVTFPQKMRHLHIVYLEMWAIILAIRLWGEQLKGYIIQISTDNEAVCTMVNTGRSHDSYLQTLLRELVWWLAEYQVQVKTVHIGTKENTLPDLLSRWGEGPRVHKLFTQKTNGKKMVRRKIDKAYFNLSHMF